MTCHRVPMSPSLCTCGVVLDITQWHGQSELGDDLCPTCSGCGCEPNERNLMNEQELDALPDGAVVLDVEDDVWQKLSGRWRSIVTSHAIPSIELLNDRLIAPVTLLRPVPEPDHSMCARLESAGDGETVKQWQLVYPNGSYDYYDNGWARARGYAIPEPEPTVVERAAKVLAAVDALCCRDESGEMKAAAIALDSAGLLVKDGER